MDSDILVQSVMLFDEGPDGRPIDPAAVCTGGRWRNPAENISGFPLPIADSGARLITDENRAVVWATSGAALLASGKSCITISNGVLSGRTRHSDALLRELFEELELAAPRAAVRLIASEPSRRPELFVQAQAYPAPGAAHILLTIRSLERDLQEIPDLGRLYGLTRTEQQISAMMIKGQSVTEISRHLHKSVLTVRTHVKRIYGKLQVGTKEQLFSTVMKLMVD